MQNIFGSKNLSGPKKNAEIDQTKICVFFLQILNSKIGPDPDFIFLNDDPQHSGILFLLTSILPSEILIRFDEKPFYLLCKNDRMKILCEFDNHYP